LAAISVPAGLPVDGPAQETLYAGVPPFATTLIDPFVAEAHAVFDGDKFTVGPVFNTTVVVAVAEHPLFVTVTV
jgi:hypothetical protein